MFTKLALINSIIWLLSVIVTIVRGHGRVMEPPARNTLWRFGFHTYPNYEDNQLFCGGIKVQWQDNDGKCGVCGDAYNGVRRHETGGFMAKNVTARRYAPGSVIDVVIELIANHGGRFYFQMCWRDTWDYKESEECFEPLQLANNEDYYDLDPSNHLGIYVIPVQLPERRTCSNCVFRWHWKTANNWGTCKNGTEEVGCGPQETYRNCADIAVDNERGIRGPLALYSPVIDERRWSWTVNRNWKLN